MTYLFKFPTIIHIDQVKKAIKDKPEFIVAKDQINLEKNVVSAIINERIDDIKPFLLHDDRVRLEEFETKFWKYVNQAALSLTEDFQDYQAMCISNNTHHGDGSDGMCRKDFALNFAAHYESMQKTILFKMYNGESALDAIKNLIKKNCGSQTLIDKVNVFWGYQRWSYYND